jgi:hypothetical protein
MAGNHATQGTAGKKPTWVDNVRAGQPVMRFNGSSEYMTIADHASIDLTGDQMIFVVAKTTDTIGHLIAHINSGAPFTGWATGIGEGGLTAGRPTYFTSGAGTWDEAGKTVHDGFWHILGFKRSGTDVVFYQNAFEIGAAAGHSNTGSTASATIGAFVDESGYLDGDIAEIIVFDSALSNADRGIIESHLMQRYLIAPGSPVLRLTAGLITGLGDADPVTTWSDDTANANDATQNTADSKPLYKTGIINGKPVLRLDGTDDLMTVADHDSLDLTGDHTIFAVLKTADTQGKLLIHFASVEPYTGWGLAVDDIGGNGKFGYWSSAKGAWFDDTTGTTLSDNVPHLLVARRTSGTVQLYVDGKTEGAEGGHGNAAPGSDLGIGREPGGSDYLSGDIAEIIIYDSSLIDASRAFVERYLERQYDIDVTPRHISGLKLWLRANSLTGLNDNDPVTTWTDSSGNANNCTQSTADKKPLYKTGILNGKPVVRFDGSDDVLIGGTISGSGVTAFLVAKSVETSNGVRALLDNSNGDPFNNLGFLIGHEDRTAFNGENSLSFGVNTGTSGPERSVYYGRQNSYTSDTWALATFSYTLNDKYYALNGVDQAPVDIFAGAGTGQYSASAQNYAVGALNSEAIHAQADIAEIIVYDSVLGADNRKLVEGYLRRKWGI